MLSRSPENTLAIIYGIGEYERMSQLPKSEKSAAEFANILLDRRFLGLPPSNLKLLNKNHNGDGYRMTEIRRWLDEIRLEIQQRKAQKLPRIETVIYYYSGHGDKNNEGELFLFAKDTSSRDFNDTGISYKRELRYLQKANVSNIIFILDCCHAGAAQGDEGNLDWEIKADHCVIQSSRAYQQSFSLLYDDFTDFSHVLFNIIRGGIIDPVNPWITIEDIGNYLDTAFQDNLKQNPDIRANQTMLKYRLLLNVSYNIDTVEEKLNSGYYDERESGITLLKHIVDNADRRMLEENAGRIKALVQRIYREALDTEMGDNI